MILVCRDDKSLTFRILHVRSVGNATQINGAEIPRHATQRATNGNEYKNILFKKKDEEHTAFTLSMDIRDPMQATMTNPNGDSEQMSELSDAIFMVKVQGDTNATTVYMVSGWAYFGVSAYLCVCVRLCVCVCICVCLCFCVCVGL